MGLFDKGGTGGGMTPATYALNRGAEGLRPGEGQSRGLQAPGHERGGQEQGRRLGDALQRHGDHHCRSNSCTTALATGIGGTSTNANKSVSNITSAVTTDLDGADMYSVMAVLATMCNYNPVIFLKYPPNYVYSGIGITADSHNLSHRLDNAGMTGSCYPNSLTLLQTIDKYYTSKFAKLVGMLDGIKNSDGSTLLDSTAAVWFNEMSDGNAHNLNNLPIIQAGGLNGYFKTGWAVNVDTANTGSATLSNGNSESQCANGTGTVNGLNQSTGTDATIANAPDQQVLPQHHERDGREGGRRTGTRPRAAPHRSRSSATPTRPRTSPAATAPRPAPRFTAPASSPRSKPVLSADRSTLRIAPE